MIKNLIRLAKWSGFALVSILFAACQLPAQEPTPRTSYATRLRELDVRTVEQQKLQFEAIDQMVELDERVRSLAQDVRERTDSEVNREIAQLRNRLTALERENQETQLALRGVLAKTASRNSFFPSWAPPANSPSADKKPDYTGHYRLGGYLLAITDLGAALDVERVGSSDRWRFAKAWSGARFQCQGSQPCVPIDGKVYQTALVAFRPASNQQLELHAVVLEQDGWRSRLRDHREVLKRID